MAAAKAGYLNGFPGLTVEAIRKYVEVEDATAAGHMRATPAGARSSTKPSARGRPKSKSDAEVEDRTAAMMDALKIPEKEPENAKTKLVFMTTALEESWIASDQTGAFPRVSSKGNKYIAIFYVFDPNFIKGEPIKSREAKDLLKAYEIIYKWCEDNKFGDAINETQ